ncbi:hypothetical protein JOE33_002116 [Pseudomonas sp. PvP027]|nr:hypothetical protein [Pseudomonas sp. PvP027]
MTHFYQAFFWFADAAERVESAIRLIFIEIVGFK